MDEQPQKKKSRKSDYNTNTVRSVFPNLPPIESNVSTLIRDTNNNRNKNKTEDDRNRTSSKSLVENPRKGKSIKRKSFNTQHVSFEGSQAPQSLSAQITSPRQLHTATSLVRWNQPSTSNAPLHANGTFLNEEMRFDDSTLENDFQRLMEVQTMYPHYQMQSTPRNELTMSFSQKNVYCSNLGRKVLFD